MGFGAFKPMCGLHLQHQGHSLFSTADTGPMETVLTIRTWCFKPLQTPTLSSSSYNIPFLFSNHLFLQGRIIENLLLMFCSRRVNLKVNVLGRLTVRTKKNPPWWYLFSIAAIDCYQACLHTLILGCNISSVIFH